MRKYLVGLSSCALAFLLSACAHHKCACGGTYSETGVPPSTIPMETFDFKTPITKVMIANTTGTTVVKHNPAQGTASLNVGRVKISDICEFKQEQKGSTLYVSVRNKGFTGAGDCEINLEVSVPAVNELAVSATTGPVQIKLPKGSTPAVRFDSKSGKLVNDFSEAAPEKGSPKIDVQTQTGYLTVKAL